MTKKNSVPSSRALPLCALVVYLISLFIFQTDSREIHANIISGLLLALTPISIIAGAVFLFRCMEITGALNTIKTWLNSISKNKVAELMIIGWSFAFLIEGASGFGTPAAIAAPVLYSLGFPALRVAVFCLIMNTIPVSFGAVGTPIWFGMSVVDLTSSELSEIAFTSALINTIAAPLVVFAGLYLVLKSWTQLLKNAVFILLSIFACTIPHLFFSTMSVEFPALIGGFIGLLLTIILAKFNVGLAQESSSVEAPIEAPPLSSVLKSSFPLWGTVLLLIITRIQQLGIKSLLQLKEPAMQFDLGYLGILEISGSLVFSLENILQTDEDWSHSLLYIPSLLPFLVIGLITLVLFRSAHKKQVFIETRDRMITPLFALFGALVFVNLMMLGDAQSPVNMIGNHLAQITEQNWSFFAPLLGALGSFFSGSATISNLTFAGIQYSIAQQLSLDTTAILALQSVGAAMGNMVCINNIVAVTSILGLTHKDGEILKRTSIVLLLYALIAGISGLMIGPS